MASQGASDGWIWGLVVGLLCFGYFGIFKTLRSYRAVTDRRRREAAVPNSTIDRQGSPNSRRSINKKRRSIVVVTIIAAIAITLTLVSIFALSGPGFVVLMGWIDLTLLIGVTFAFRRLGHPQSYNGRSALPKL